MAEKITIRINDGLKTLFNVNDPIYKAIVCDKDGIPEATITKPSDFNLGAITDQLEYLRRLQIDLLKQMFIDQASGEFLKYSLENFFRSLRLQVETDEDWIQRTISLIFQPRVSRASIIFALRPYSSQEPEIISGGGDAMFADVSFAGRYKKYNTMYNGKNFSVYPSIAQTAGSAFFSIVIILYGTSANQLYSVADLINQYIAAGINYTIEIR